jgi:hypothetical protein
VEGTRDPVRRGSLPPLPPPEDPATVVAVARCVMARFLPPTRRNKETGLLERTVSANHPVPCRFDIYPTDILVAYCDTFMEQSGLRAADRFDARKFERLEEPVEAPRLSARVALFMAMPRKEQAELVERAMTDD